MEHQVNGVSVGGLVHEERVRTVDGLEAELRDELLERVEPCLWCGAEDGRSVHFNPGSSSEETFYFFVHCRLPGVPGHMCAGLKNVGRLETYLMVLPLESCRFR
jgi:hypothetical protein